MAVNLTADELLPEERAVVSKKANLIVLLTDHGLERVPIGAGMGLVGMKDAEAIGGKLHLTTARLVFKAHAFNRLKGSVSIFLPSVRGARDTSKLVVRKLRVETPSQDFEFVMWGIAGFLEQLERRRAALGEDARAELLAAIAQHPGALGGDLELHRSVDRLVGGSTELIDVLAQAGEDDGLVSTVLNLADLLSDA